MLSMLAILAMVFASAPTGFASTSPGDRGWGIDPNGAPAHAAAAACTDRGGMIDPNGCPQRATADEGPGACPHGGHTMADQGSAIDPNGTHPTR